MAIKFSSGLILLSAALLSGPVYADATGTQAPGGITKAEQAPGGARAAEQMQAPDGTNAAPVLAPDGTSEAEQAPGEPSKAGQLPGKTSKVRKALGIKPLKPGREVDRITLHYLEDYFVDTGKIIASPLHGETNDWLKLGLVLGVTSSMFLIDNSVNKFALRNQSPVASGIADVGNAFGNPLYVLPPIGAFYLFGYLTDDSKARRASLLALESYTVSAALTSGLKVLADRHRPNTGDGPTTWDGPRFSFKNLSFSSAHTAAAFSIATVFANEYKDNAYVAPIAYGLATLTGLSRIYGNEHWSSDVFFGAAIGYFTSKALLNYHKEDKSSLARRLTVLPEVGPGMAGLSVKLDF